MSDNENFVVRTVIENAQNEKTGQKSFEKIKDQIDEFASGLPSWDLTPPLMVIKRVKRNI